MALAAALLGVFAPLGRLAAQTVRGTVTDGTGRGVAGAMVLLLDSTSTIVGRTLTAERGDYRLTAPRAGRYRVRTLRIGFQPELTAPIDVQAGAVITTPILLAGVRVALDTVRVERRSACRIIPAADASALATVWNQAMTGLTASTLTSGLRGLTATTRRVERTLDANGRRVRTEQATIRTDVVTQPWKVVPADSLRIRGYVTQDLSGGYTYDGPSLEVFTAPAFLEDHCLQLVRSSDSTEVGVRFDPVPERRRRSELSGTLWLTRASAQLRRLTFSFLNVPNAPQAASQVAGGDLQFAQLPDGSVVIAGWELRMPQLERLAARAISAYVAEVVSTGGELLLLRRGADTLYTSTTVAIAAAEASAALAPPLVEAPRLLATVPKVSTAASASETAPPPPGPRDAASAAAAAGQALRAVTVVADRPDPGLADFEANKRVGLGHFLTRDDLAKQEGRKLSDVLLTVPGVGLVQGSGSRAWILSRRYIAPIRNLGGRNTVGAPGDPSYLPTKQEAVQGIVAGCYAKVYVDAMLMNPTTPAEPFDVNGIAPDRIQSVEWYASPAQTPSRYTTLNSPCGVLVIHTRRP